MDEITEFSKQVLEALRQPLEDKFINVTRSNFSVKFPCNFILIATMNPCQCGYNLDRKIKCICSEAQLNNYKKRLSGPILDRFDMFIDIEKIPINDFFGKNFDKNESYKNELLQNIKMAEFMQKQRFRDHRRIKSNSDMQLMEIRNCCSIDEESRKILTDASKNLNLSNRGYLRTLKIARTIADLEGKTNILSSHILEAIQYRQLIKNQDSSILCQ